MKDYLTYCHHMVLYGPFILRYCITPDGPCSTTSNGIWDNGQFSMLIICRLEHSANSNGKLCRFGLSLTYKDSRFSSVPISSGKYARLFSPAPKYTNFVRWPIALGKDDSWFDWTISFCNSRRKPISFGSCSRRFSSKSSTRSFWRLPMLVGIFRSRLLERMRTCNKT